MLYLNRKIEYGLIAIMHLDFIDRSRLATAKEIAKKHGLPGELVGKVMQTLVHGHVVESVHGAKGGYRLARPLEKLSLGDVIEAIEGPIRLTRCQGETEQCKHYNTCNIIEPVDRVQGMLQRFLHDISLSSFRKTTQLKGQRQQIGEERNEK